ncbi:MAG: tRNA pseudouridine(55) synthase TruB, partial [Gemmatimonadota bacterium]
MRTDGGGGGSVGQGILAIDKQAGPTSHDVVAQLRRILGVRRVGHCGTLDPLATGLLVVCFGRYTRLADWIGAAEKEYEATFILGADSDTGDAEGCLVQRAIERPPTESELLAAAAEFVGTISQVPPAHSAIKVGGVPSYRLARDQRPVALQPRLVRIDRFAVVGYAYPRLEVEVVCGKGTYIRSLAADLGGRLGCGAYVESLRRRRVGAIGLDDAAAVEVVGQGWNGQGCSAPYLVPPNRALQHLEAVSLESGVARAFAHGRAVERPGAPNAACAVYGPGAALLGIGRRGEDGARLRPLAVVDAPRGTGRERQQWELIRLAWEAARGSGS